VAASCANPCLVGIDVYTRQMADMIALRFDPE
jgi:hypothetical protein